MFSKVQASTFLVASLPLLANALPLTFRNATLLGTRADKVWKLQDEYAGDNFFDGFGFFTGNDPTNGLVDYVDQDTATKEGLAKVTNGVAVIAADATTQLKSGENRKSVRISSKKTYNGGLFIADFAAMPVGCGTWPAYWLVGPNWPSGGEIDVIEGVHESTVNQIAMHTSEGCSIDNSKASQITGTLGNPTCTSGATGNAGCQTTDSSPKSFGEPFNAAGGGTMAVYWDHESDLGIRVWFWSKGSVPDDVTKGQPNVATWGKPTSWLADGSSCDVKSHFHDMSIIINLTFCGDWAGNSYNRYPDNTTSQCPGTCADAVADPSNYKEAQWKVNYIHVYN